MTTFAVGDLQGCLAPLHTLLDRVRFRPGLDRLWLVGDLVNRGPQSLETLRFIRSLGTSAVSVLGNHDLHLLAVAAGTVPPSSKDTLQGVLEAPDRGELLEWLRHRPMLHHQHGVALVHAGIPAAWDIETACARARELEAVLRGRDFQAFLARMYGNEPDRWSERLAGWDRLRFITNAFTRMRYCYPDGRLELTAKGPPGSQPAGTVPWFEVPERRTRALGIVIGHWGTLQMLAPLDPVHNVWHLDTGCALGLTLTALRLEDRRYFSVACAETGRHSRWRP